MGCISRQAKNCKEALVRHMLLPIGFAAPWMDGSNPSQKAGRARYTPGDFLEMNYAGFIFAYLHRKHASCTVYSPMVTNDHFRKSEIIRKNLRKWFSLRCGLRCALFDADLYRDRGSVGVMRNLIPSDRHPVICINDARESDKEYEFWDGGMRVAFEEILPESCSFEFNRCFK